MPEANSAPIISNPPGRYPRIAPMPAQKPKLPPFLRNTFARRRLRHSNHPGITRSQRCQHDHDLHSCPQQRRPGCT